MTALPVVPTFTVERAKALEFRALADALTFLLNPPFVQLRQTVAQSIPNNADTALLFATEDADLPSPGGQHNTASQTSRFTAVYPGWYQVSATVAFSTNATGLRITSFAKNGTILAGTKVYTQAISGNLTVFAARTTFVQLAVGDYVEFMVYQNSGSALNTSVGSTEQSTMSVRFISA